LEVVFGAGEIFYPLEMGGQDGTTPVTFTSQVDVALTPMEDLTIFESAGLHTNFADRC